MLREGKWKEWKGKKGWEGWREVGKKKGKGQGGGKWKRYGAEA